MKRILRLARLGVHLAAGCALSAWLYPRLPRPARAARRARWSRRVLEILGVRLQAHLCAIAPGSLLVANHVSWLDAVALSALVPDASLAAKAETRRWPLLGRLLERNDTLFVERRPCRALLALNAAIGARLAGGGTVAAFPEGTTTDGAAVGAFRPALFEPAVRGAHAVHALALVYRDRAGRRCTRAAYVGDMSLWQSAWRLAAHDGLELAVESCAVVRSAGLHRREAARLARAAVQARIAAIGSASPGGGTVPSRSATAWASSPEVSRT